MAHLPTTDQMQRLAHAVVTEGFDAHRDAVADLVRSARALGIRPVLADVVADADAPRPVRERALGLLLVALAAQPTSHDLVTTAPASAA